MLDIKWLRAATAWTITFGLMLVSFAWGIGQDFVSGGTEVWSNLDDALKMLFSGTSLWSILTVISVALFVFVLDKMFDTHSAAADGRKKGLKRVYTFFLLILISVLAAVAAQMFSTGLSWTALFFFGVPTVVAIAASLRKRPTTTPTP